MRHRPATPEQIHKAHEMRERGVPIQEIAEELGLSTSWVSKATTGLWGPTKGLSPRLMRKLLELRGHA